MNTWVDALGKAPFEVPFLANITDVRAGSFGIIRLASVTFFNVCQTLNFGRAYL